MAAAIVGLAPHAAAQAPPEPAWGAERDGFQARLTIVPALEGYRPGDVVSIQITLKNVSAPRGPVQLKGFETWTVAVGPGGAITLDPLPGSPITVDLSPGEQRTFDGPRLRISSLQPLESTARKPFAGTEPIPVPLLAGKYEIRCPMPFWVPDLNDPNRATALRVAPAPVSVTVRSTVDSPVLFPAGPYSSTVAYGEPVDGLMPELTTESGKTAFVPGDTMRSEFAVQNITNRTISFSHPSFQEYDLAPMVVESGGHTVHVESVFVSGLRRQVSVTLKPGERTVLARPVLHLRAGEKSANMFHVPEMPSNPGDYLFSYVIWVQVAGAPRANIVLVTGKAPFRIGPDKRS